MVKAQAVALSPLAQALLMQLENVAREGHVSRLENAQIAVHIASRQDAALYVPIGRPRDIEDAARKASNGSHRRIAIADVEDAVYDGCHLAAKQFFFLLEFGQAVEADIAREV